MSQAIAPPMVTWRVPGSTGTHSPNGNAAFISESRLTPASRSTMWVSASIEWIRLSGVMSMTSPPPFWALSPYERPSPRAITPRPSACDTALAITSGSGVDSTWATLGAVRPQPVSRFVLVSNIVTRVPPDGSGSAQPEYDRPLDDEVDHSRGALGDDERHRHSPRLVIEQMQEEMIESDLDDEGQCVEHHDRDEPDGAGFCLKRPPSVDQVGGNGADNEADGLGHVDLQPDGLVQEHVQAEVHDRRETAGDDEPPDLGFERQVRRHGGLSHPGSLSDRPDVSRLRRGVAFAGRSSPRQILVIGAGQVGIRSGPATARRRRTQRCTRGTLRRACPRTSERPGRCAWRPRSQ